MATGVPLGHRGDSSSISSCTLPEWYYRPSNTQIYFFFPLGGRGIDVRVLLVYDPLSLTALWLGECMVKPFFYKVCNGILLCTRCSILSIIATHMIKNILLNRE